jgi:hypothetical protein
MDSLEVRVMKDSIFLAIFVVCWSAALTYEATASDSNKAMKKCLAEYGYSPDKFYHFDFSKPAGCHSDWRIGETKRRYAEMKEFLKEHPWYKGNKWQWEECAKDNRCTRQYSWWSTKEK